MKIPCSINLKRYSTSNQSVRTVLGGFWLFALYILLGTNMILPNTLVLLSRCRSQGSCFLLLVPLHQERQLSVTASDDLRRCVCVCEFQWIVPHWGYIDVIHDESEGDRALPRYSDPEVSDVLMCVTNAWETGKTGCKPPMSQFRFCLLML